jgi:hypothetical protein
MLVGGSNATRPRHVIEIIAIIGGVGTVVVE